MTGFFMFIMKKTILLFLLFLAVYGAVNLTAQVRIGGGSAADPSSVLDLNPSDTANAGGGLLLPRVHLDSLKHTGVFGGTVKPRKGLMVYNLNEDDDHLRPTEGIYCYNGEEWIPLNLSAPKYKGRMFEITVTSKSLWLGNDGELTEHLDVTFSRLPNEDDLGGCTMEYIGYLTDMVENTDIEFALTPDLQIADRNVKVYLQIADMKDHIVKGRVYKLSCVVRVSQYETNRVDAGYVVYGAGAWLDKRNGRWINVAPANMGATFTWLSVQSAYTPDGDDDPAVYGDLYQWGRKRDGHQYRTADTILFWRDLENGVDVLNANGQIPDTLSAYGKFIQRTEGAKDWRTYPGDPDNSITSPANAWTWAHFLNNPCETELGEKWRVPTADEWVQICKSNNWVWKDGSAGISGYAIMPDDTTKTASVFLPVAGQRDSNDGRVSVSNGYYWSNTAYGDSSCCLFFNRDTIVPANPGARAYGFSVRCVADGEGSQKPEPEPVEYMGGSFTFTATPKQVWLGRDGGLGLGGSPVSITFGSGQSYRVEYVWHLTDTASTVRVVTSKPELRIFDGTVEGGIDVWPEGARIEKGKVYKLSCHVRMGPDNDFETSKVEAGYVVYGIGAWTGPGKWLNVANANVGADSTVTLNNQLALDHRRGYNRLVMGDYFQWGRAVDGHEQISSDTVRSIVPASQLDSTGTPGVNSDGEGKFILSGTVSDWREYPDTMTTNEKRKTWYWRTKEEPNTGVDPCKMGDKWFVMTRPQWDSIRIYNRLAWLDTDFVRGVAVYPNDSDDVSFYLPISGTRVSNTGDLFPADADWHGSWATGIWLNTPDTDLAKAIGLTWSSGSDPSINTGSSNPRTGGFPIRCVSE